MNRKERKRQDVWIVNRRMKSGKRMRPPVSWDWRTKVQRVEEMCLIEKQVSVSRKLNGIECLGIEWKVESHHHVSSPERVNRVSRKEALKEERTERGKEKAFR